MSLRAFVGVFVLLSACAVDDSGDLAGTPTHRIGGVARGVPASGVRLVVTGDLDAAVEVPDDGPFAVAEAIADGAAFALDVVAPQTHACGVTPVAGVARADVQVELTCRRRPSETCPAADAAGWHLRLAEAGTVAAVEGLADGRVLVIGSVPGRDGPRGRLWWLDPSGRVPDADRVVREVDLPGPPFAPVAAAWTATGGFVLGDRGDDGLVDGIVVAVDAEGAPRPGFGVDGAVVLVADPEPDCVNPGPPSRRSVDLALTEPDGLWVVGEWSTPCQVTRPLVVRLPRAEPPARSFVREATSVWPLEPPNSTRFPQAWAAAPDGDGLLIAGRFWSGGEWQAGLRRMRVAADGGLAADRAFGAMTLARPPDEGGTVSDSVALGLGRDGAGRLLAVGRWRRFGGPRPSSEGAGWMVWRGGAVVDPADPPRGLAVAPTRALARDSARAVAADGDDGALVAGLVDGADGLTVGVRALGASAPPGEVWTATGLAAVDEDARVSVARGAAGCVWFGVTAGGAPTVGAFQR